MDFVQQIQALTPALTPIGGGIAWFWYQIDRRFKRIDRELEKCRRREKSSDMRRAALITIIELLWRAVEREAPESAELHRVQKLMDDYRSIGEADKEDET